MKIRLATAVAAVALFTAAPASAQIEIQWWHAMGGALGDWVQDLADDFNASQDDYVVIPTNRGNYTETMTAAVAAFRAGEQPHIVQVFEVGTATMMAAEGAVYPVYQLMEDTGQPFDPSVYLAAVTGYYTTADGQMLSLPFNSSTPVMYYNRDQGAIGYCKTYTYDSVKGQPVINVTTKFNCIPPYDNDAEIQSVIEFTTVNDSVMTARTPSRLVPLAAQSRDEPDPYSLPPSTTRGMSCLA